MFGLIVAGRLVQTDFQQVSENKFVVNIDNADEINHLVMFMTGEMPFAEGLGGAVYITWSKTEEGWMLLGHLTNDKPSAVFKVSGLRKGGASENTIPFQMPVNTQCNTAQVGISVEPLSHLSQQTPARNTTASNVDTFKEFTVKMAENFYNFASSFSVTQIKMEVNPSISYVPMNKLSQWYENITRKLAQDPYFWRT